MDNVDLSTKLTMVEYFAGAKNVAKAFDAEPSHRVATFELKDSPAMDINSAPGLAFLVTCMSWGWKPRLALSLALRSAPGALHVMAPVCSSWTRISRGTSWRTKMNYMGDLSSKWVVDANSMVSRLGHIEYTL